MPILRWTYSRIDALSFTTVLPSYYHFFASNILIVWISFYLETSSLESFSIFYDLIASFYRKGKWQWRQGCSFCFKSYHFDEKMFLYIFLFFWWENIFLHLLIFLQYDLKSYLIRNCLVKSQILGYYVKTSLKYVKNATKIWIGDKVNLLLT